MEEGKWWQEENLLLLTIKSSLTCLNNLPIVVIFPLKQKIVFIMELYELLQNEVIASRDTYYAMEVLHDW